MNPSPKQIRLIIVSVTVFVLIGLFPPWVYTLDTANMHTEKPAGFALIVKPPTPERDAPAFGVRLDMSRLFVEWLILAASASLGLLLTKRKPEN